MTALFSNIHVTESVIKERIDHRMKHWKTEVNYQ